MFRALILFLVLTVTAFAESNLCWQRRSVDWNRCKKEGKTPERCTKENAEDNRYNFESLLSPQAYKVYEDFTVDEKERAMDYADGDRMDPNNAVAKVARER